jgi:hypothetical protein
MPYFQEGDRIYWWNPGARKRRPGAGEPAPYANNPAAPYRPHPEAPPDESPDPHRVRDTTVRAPGDG